jgi:hypothetical protein
LDTETTTTFVLYWMETPEGNAIPWKGGDKDGLGWGRWFHQGSNRVVERTVVGTWEVSTSFLGINYGPRSGPPLLYETMIFSTTKKELEIRKFANVEFQYHTRESAKVGHRKIVQAMEDGVSFEAINQMSIEQ